MAREPIIKCDELRDLLELDYDALDIAAHFRVSRQTVYNGIDRCGLKTRFVEPRFNLREECGWTVHPDHRQDHHLMMLSYAEKERRGIGLPPPEKAAEVASWVAWMLRENQVLTYHPSPSIGVRLARKRAGDELLFRPGHYCTRTAPEPPRKRRKAG